MALYPHARRRSMRRPFWILNTSELISVAILAFCVIPVLVHAFGGANDRRITTEDHQTVMRASLGDRVTVHASAAGRSSFNIGEGHELLTAYSGPTELQSALMRDQAVPLTLASADFDEDGVPDLVS